MSILTALTSAYSLEEAFGSTDCTTDAMQEAIKVWFALYYDREPTKQSDPCQRIAYTVVNKLTKTCFGEYTAASDDEYVQSVLDALDISKRKAMQVLLAGGEAFIKPLPLLGGWTFGIIPRNNVLVFGRDAAGTPIDIGTIERSTEGRYFYTLLERRTVDVTGHLTIRNKLYRSDEEGHLGSPVPLESLTRYEGLVPEYTYPTPLGGLGLVHLRVPIENVVDGSPDGVSVYAAAVGLIRNIDRNEALINGEFERGQSRIFVSDDLMKRDKNGKRSFADDVFVGIDEDHRDAGVTIFSPALREQSFLARKTEYLRNVESIIGIKRGLLSEVEAVERTAKEVTSSEGDYNLTIIDLQDVWAKAVEDTVKLCGILGKLYNIAGAHEVGEDAVTIDWGNGILYDRDKTWSELMGMVSSGLLKPEKAVGWYFDMPTESPKDLAAIREQYMPEATQMEEDGEE